MENRIEEKLSTVVRDYMIESKTDKKAFNEASSQLVSALAYVLVGAIVSMALTVKADQEKLSVLIDDICRLIKQGCNETFREMKAKEA